MLIKTCIYAGSPYTYHYYTTLVVVVHMRNLFFILVQHLRFDQDI